MQKLRDAQTALNIARKLAIWIETKRILVDKDSSLDIDVSVGAFPTGYSMPIPYKQVMDFVDETISNYEKQIIGLGFDPKDLSALRYFS